MHWVVSLHGFKSYSIDPFLYLISVFAFHGRKCVYLGRKCVYLEDIQRERERERERENLCKRSFETMAARFPREFALIVRDAGWHRLFSALRSDRRAIWNARLRTICFSNWLKRRGARETIPEWLFSRGSFDPNTIMVIAFFTFYYTSRSNRLFFE